MDESHTLSVTLLPYGFARNHWVLINKSSSILHCARTSLAALTEAQSNLTGPAKFEQVTEEQFTQTLSALYEESSSDTSLVEMELDESEDDHNNLSTEDILASDSDAPVIRLLNAVILKAVRAEASDIHIETYENRLLVRTRVDGVLRDLLDTKAALAPRLVSRIKVMAKLDIAERRVPQDGRIGIKLGHRMIDVRVSTLPSTHGERVVMRLLTRSTDQLDIRNAGLADAQLSELLELLSSPHGILLVTGPTGSGKTTTLYASLNQIKDGRKNILTIEDPVEFDLMGIGQTPVNIGAGMTFAKGLRAVLRQDPDVVMVGEIRDTETAEIAVQASLTGHLVLSTLHTNTAIGAITRLIDMGVEPFLISSSLIGVIAQRLVRILCPECKEQYSPDTALRERLSLASNADIELYRAKGCEHCEHSGYIGRTGIYEMIKVDEKLRDMIHQQADEQKLTAQARQTSQSIFEQGLQLVQDGKTSAEELLRVAQESS